MICFLALFCLTNTLGQVTVYDVHVRTSLALLRSQLVLVTGYGIVLKKPVFHFDHDRLVNSSSSAVLPSFHRLFPSRAPVPPVPVSCSCPCQARHLQRHTPSLITAVSAREVVDAQGGPTVEAEITTHRGTFRAIAPASDITGMYYS